MNPEKEEECLVTLVTYILSLTIRLMDAARVMLGKSVVGTIQLQENWVKELNRR